MLTPHMDVIFMIISQNALYQSRSTALLVIKHVINQLRTTCSLHTSRTPGPQWCPCIGWSRGRMLPSSHFRRPWATDLCSPYVRTGAPEQRQALWLRPHDCVLLLHEFVLLLHDRVLLLYDCEAWLRIQALLFQNQLEFGIKFGRKK